MRRTIQPWKQRVDNSAMREEINRENREAIWMFAVACIPLGIVNFAAQLVVVGGGAMYTRGLLMVAYATLLLAAEHWLIPKNYPHSTALLYLVQTPTLLLATLLGTVWDPQHQAITFLMCLMIMPSFFMDRPARIALWQGLWCVFFAILCCRCKDAELFRVDLVHVVEFYIASLVVMELVLNVRLSFLENMEEKQYVLRHDRRTGCLSRYALEERTGGFVDRPLTLLLAELDHLRLYRDFFGHNAADDMMMFFCRTFADAFGENVTFRYSGGDKATLKASDLGHTHLGSLGNLCNDKIAALMDAASNWK